MRSIDADALLEWLTVQQERTLTEITGGISVVQAGLLAGEGLAYKAVRVHVTSLCPDQPEGP